MTVGRMTDAVVPSLWGNRERRALGQRAPGYARAVADMTEALDGSLADAISAGQEEALAEVYRRHAPALFGLARRVVGDRTLAEEVVQEVFVHLWRTPGGFDPDRGTMRAYLLALTHGRSVDLVRSEVARRKREEREATYDPPAPQALDETVVHEVAVVEEVRGAMAVLPDQERRPIELAYYGGHTYREVAGMLGEPEGTVKSRIRAGLRRLGDALTEREIG